MQRITPHLWCAGTAAEAGAFYASVLPDCTWRVAARYPDTEIPEAQRDLAGAELLVEVTIAGYRLRLINAGGEFRPNPSVSFLVTIDPRQQGPGETAREAIDRMWAALSDGGTVRMELGNYPHSPHYGWVEDRYGANWQLLLVPPEVADGDAAPAQLITPHLMFTGPDPHAREAIDFYTSLFDDAAPGTLLPYPPGSDPFAGDAPGSNGASGSLMFADFTLTGLRFSAADGGNMHGFTFSPGVSLQVDCDDQGEIDRLWTALSAVPEAERCGWLVDRFGVSWQIVPAALGRLLQRPGAYQRMLGMTRLVIAEI